MSSETDRAAAIAAVRRAATICRAVQAELSLAAGSMVKGDRSPVTIADFGAQAATSLTLRQHGKNDPIVGEENADALRKNDARAIRARVVSHVQATDPSLDEDHVLDAIDACDDPGGRSGRRWVLDPIDGTKGYLRSGQYAIALGLLEDGEVTLGVLGCPSLPSGGAVNGDRNGEVGCLFVAQKGAGTVQIPLAAEDAESVAVPVRTSQLDDPAAAAFCESVEAAHSAHDRHAQIAALLGVVKEPVRMDSQCKYGVVARGEAAIYLRLPRDESYREKIWDHAAGWLVVQEAGGQVTDVLGRELDFGLGRTLDKNRGIVATNGLLHEAVLKAIRSTEPVGPAR